MRRRNNSRVVLFGMILLAGLPSAAWARERACMDCHEEAAAAVNNSSHGKKMTAWLEQKNKDRPANLCTACHRQPPHDMKKGEAGADKQRIAEMCLTCHREVQPVNIEKYASSVHGLGVQEGKKAAACTDCHGSHSIDHSSLATSRVHHGNIPETCGACHPAQKADYEQGIHWASVKKGFREAPVCTDCHGEHGILSRSDPASRVWKGNVTKTCAACHALEKIVSKFMLPGGRVESFKDSFHGLSGDLGDLRVANCGSCHGVHRVLPSTDPRSPIHPANLGRTCGQCHPGAEVRFVSGRVHSSQTVQPHWGVDLVRTIYIALIFVTIGGMLIHNLLDLIHKSTRGVLLDREELLTPRFSVNERWQHGLLASSFILLAVSGFALKFPESFFAWPFTWFSAGAQVRQWVHRLAAMLFVLIGVFHIFYLYFTWRGRLQLEAMKPRWKDVSDLKNILARYGGRKPMEPLRVSHYTYVEKLEYFALLWGGVIMTVTGAVLFFINTSLSNLPLWGVDLAVTIHFWEAVLACLAILIWHGYWVIFDPEIYPMNLTWILGNPKASRTQEKKET